VAPDLPAALAGIITRALAKDPDARWQSAADMAETLRRAGEAEQLLSPREVRQKVRRRWYRRTAVLLAGLLLGLGSAVWLAVKVWRLMYSGGRPSVDAMAPRIPANLIDSARALGALTPGDTALYVFAPAGGGMTDAFIVTTRDMVAPVGGGFKRYPIARDYSLNLRLNPDGGFLVITDPVSGVADTIYRKLAGQEQRVLLQALAAALPKDSS
jgi:hypothetical protein